MVFIMYPVPPHTLTIEEKVSNMTQQHVAILTCTAMAWPRPSITWYKVNMDNSRTIITGRELGISLTVTNGDNERVNYSTIEFYPTRPSFSATYVCEAMNPVSSAETNVTLLFQGRLS